MTLTGMKKHVGVLELAGLVTTEKVGRVRTCKLGPRRLDEETAWIERYCQLWASRFDELDKIVEELKQKEIVNGRNKRTEPAPRRTARQRNESPIVSWSSSEPSMLRRASCSRRGPSPSCSNGGGYREVDGRVPAFCELDVRTGGIVSCSARRLNAGGSSSVGTSK